MSNRSEIAGAIAETLDITKKYADEVLLTVTHVLQGQLATKGEAVLPGFGRLKVQHKPARKGHNPKTGEPIDIPAKMIVKFKAFSNGKSE